MARLGWLMGVVVAWTTTLCGRGEDTKVTSMMSSTKTNMLIQKNKKLRNKCVEGSFCDYMLHTNISYTRNNQSETMSNMYDSYHRQRGGAKFETLNDEVLAMLLKHFPPGQYPASLDGGVGQCHMVREMTKSGYTHVRGHEVSQFAIDNFCDGMNVSHGLLRQTPYGENEFDVITSIDVIEHVPVEDIPATFAELHRVLKPGGMFIFKLGPCAKNCGGFCTLQAIHPSGICERLPFSWWHSRALDAGLVDLPPALRLAVESDLKVRDIGCCNVTGKVAKDGYNTITGAYCRRSNHPPLPCGASPNGSNIFFYTKVE